VRSRVLAAEPAVASKVRSIAVRNASDGFSGRGTLGTCQAYSRVADRRARHMLAPVPHHLRPSTAYAPDALLPGDPARALALAQLLLTEPRMSNHARGLWGYTGETPEGRQLSIQATGMGGPSAAIVLQELAELGVRRGIRVGTCGAIDPGLRHGELVVARDALAQDGASRALGAGETAEPDPDLTAHLAAFLPAGASPSRIVTTDLFYEGDTDEGGPPRARADAWRRRGAVAVEMEAATMFTLGERLGLATACVLAVSDIFEDGDRDRIGDDDLSEAAERMGSLAAAALAAQP
jgi:purine-nucleoside phosphorylase